jgi:hypothetical protein
MLLKGKEQQDIISEETSLATQIHYLKRLNSRGATTLLNDRNITGTQAERKTGPDPKIMQRLGVNRSPQSLGH